MASEVKERVLSVWKEIYDGFQRDKNYDVNNRDKEYDWRYTIIAGHSLKVIAKCYEDWIAHNGKKIDCDPDTQKIYKDCYECTYRTSKYEKDQKMREAICPFANAMDDILAEFGIGRNQYTQDINYRVIDLNKFFLKVWDEYLDKRIQELGIKGLKLKKRSTTTCNSHELFDFSNVEIVTNERKEE